VFSAADAVRIDVADADLERGAAVYAEQCAACHGVELEGQPNWRRPGRDGVLPAPPHDATGHTWHHPDEVLFRYTKLGGARLMAERGVTGFESGMPPFGDVLSDGEIRDVIAFIKSRWPERERNYQRAITLQSANGS
jgi:mono/diheme cytochrome c family protein